MARSGANSGRGGACVRGRGRGDGASSFRLSAPFEVVSRVSGRHAFRGTCRAGCSESSHHQEGQRSGERLSEQLSEGEAQRKWWGEGGRERRGGGRFGQGASGCPDMEPAPPRPRERCPRWREGHEQRAAHTSLPGPRCPLGKGTQVEAGTRRHARGRKVPTGTPLSLYLNYASRTPRTLLS